MWSVFRKEVSSFFTSIVGYLVMGLFLVLTGLFLWVFKGPFNIFDYGFADLSLFFTLAPWIFLLLIPAITMKSFSEERKLGTLELMLSRPISTSSLVLGKFLGAMSLSLIALAPTLLYVWTLHELGTTVGNLDTGLVIGSYIGLFFLMAAYTGVGLFASALTENQIASFLIAILCCFILYFGFESLAGLTGSGSLALLIENFGMKAHYESINQGILDSRDLIYFISVCGCFLIFAVLQLNRLKA